MKAYIFIPFALLIGLLLGGWGPRSELRSAKHELQKTQRLLNEGPGRQAAGADVENVTRLLGISRTTQARTKGTSGATVEEERQDRTKDGGAESNAVQVAETETAGEALPTDAKTETQGQDRKKRMEEDIAKAMVLWKLRSDIARATFLANGDFPEKSAIDFDVLMAAMNVRLSHTIEAWAADVEEKEHVGAEEGVRLMNGVTEALMLTYDAMDEKLPEDWRETAGKGMRLFDFIDPSVATPIIGVEDRLDEITGALETTQNGADGD